MSDLEKEMKISFILELLQSRKQIDDKSLKEELSKKFQIKEQE
jgi:hypothetical protein